MAYLVNSARLSSISLNGVDYTPNLISWTCNDSSAFKNGLIQTTGSVVLGTVPGSSLEDYDRNLFKRGQEVILSVTYPDGTTERHPRGLMYVVGVSYEPESESIIVETACRIAMAALTDKTDALVSLPSVPLDPARKQDYQNISSALAAEGKVAYQDNQGNLITVDFFGSDSSAGFEAGDWVSVLGETALSVAPLAGSSPLPDGIKLSYQVPTSTVVDETDQGDQESSNKTQEDTVESYYFLTYPATVYVREGDGQLPGDTTDGSVPNPVDTGCGNTPTQPGDNGQGNCNDNYTLSQTPLTIPAYKRQLTRTNYKGPGGQVSTRYSEVRGPALEANQQYYADKFAYCRYVWATACQPNGGCDTDGTQEILLGYTEQTNSYGDSGELVSTVTDTYIPTLAAAQPFDWRSGVVAGAPQNFQELSTSTMFRSQRRIEDFSTEGNANVTTVTTYTSNTARQSGISSGKLDAMEGQRTLEVRKSTTITGSPVRPDTVNTVETATEDKEVTLLLFGTSYVTPPAESGPYYLKESVPVPVLYENEAEIDSFIGKYSTALTLFTKGDALGLQVGESLRKEIADTWKPGAPFRYCDPYKSKISAMRMDATTWSVDSNQSVLVTSGLWLGFSDGTLNIPSNVRGNSTPTMGGGGDPTPPPGAGAPPSVDSETVVSPGAQGWEVDIQIYTDTPVTTYGNQDGVLPPLPTGDNTEINQQQTMMCYVKGILVQPGGLSSPDGDGGIPLSLRGSLILSNAVVVDGDLFA